MSDIFAASPDAPPAIVAALAVDRPAIALSVLEFSPLLIDSDLVDIVATGCQETQCAIARRAQLPVSVSAAIAEVGDPAATLELIENPGVLLAPFSIDRIVERHGHLAAIREALLQMDDLPMSTRVGLVAQTSATLARFVAARDWMTPERADRIAAEAVERSMVEIATSSQGDKLMSLVRHLRGTGQLNAGLILRALLSGNTDLFEASLTELTGLPQRRIAALMYNRGGVSINALLTKAGLPVSTFPAFRAALETIAEMGFVDTFGGAARLQRRMVERVLTRCETEATAMHEPLLVLLRRFATEAAREEARLFCEDTVDEIDALQFVQAIEDAPSLADVEIYGDYTEFDENYTEVNDNEAAIVAAYEPVVDEYDDGSALDEDYTALNDDGYDDQYGDHSYMNIRVGERIAA
jgi:uncharacterized protein (DUF2336 family)